MRRRRGLLLLVTAGLFLTTGARAEDEPEPAAPAAPVEPEAPTLPAVIGENVTLSGRYRMTHDVEIPRGVVVRIAAGTEIEVATEDEKSLGWDTARCELHVHGRILAMGSVEEPILFSAPTDAERKAKKDSWLARTAGMQIVPQGRWFGIVLHPDRELGEPSRFRHVRVSLAETGLLLSRGRPEMDHCVFFRCKIGVSPGNLWKDRERAVERALGPEPVIRASVFAHCATGVYGELSASAQIERSTFVRCRLGVGNERDGKQYFQSAPGPRLDRCLFFENSVAVQGPSVVENSLFVRNSVVAKLTEFHTTFSAEIDRYCWRGNVLHENVRTSSGESDLGVGQILGNPQLSAPPVSVPLRSIVTPSCGVSLAPDSAVRGRALDGGDPGPTGNRRLGNRERPWRATDDALRTVLVLGPAESLMTLDPAKVTAPKRAGDRVKNAWWAAIPCGDDGALHAAALGWPEGTTLHVAAPFVLEDPSTPLELEINADGKLLSWIDDKLIRMPVADRRFGAWGERVPLDAGAARRLVRVQWSPTDLAPRLGVAVLGGAAFDPAGADGEVARIQVVPVTPRRGEITFRIVNPYHWADLSRGGVFVLEGPGGARIDLAAHGLRLGSRPGFVKADLPDDFPRKGLRLVLTGLRDPLGRPLAGQPARVSFDR